MKTLTNIFFIIISNFKVQENKIAPQLTIYQKINKVIPLLSGFPLYLPSLKINDTSELLHSFSHFKKLET